MIQEKPKVYKRVIAYIIDYVIITLLAGILSLVLINSEKYDEDTKKVLNLAQQYVSGEIDEKAYQSEFNDLNYYLNLDSIGVTIITVCVTVIYFVVMCYFCHGITLGKFLMKLQIVSANDKDLNIFNYLLRSLIVNSVLSNIISIIMIKVLSKESFINSYTIVSNIFSITLLLTFIVMIYRSDGRGIHDLLGNTKVIDLKKEKDIINVVAENE